MTRRALQILVAALVSLLLLCSPAHGRQYISVVGSSTVYPFATVVAERFGKSTVFATPKIESTGSGGGLKLFCSGVGLHFPDITNASRRIKPSELNDCFANGVDEVIEVQIGYDGIVLANSVNAEHYNLELRDIYLALAERVPDPSGLEFLVLNPYTHWNQIRPDLPEVKIEVLGPPPTSGTRDAFSELALDAGCSTYQWISSFVSTESIRDKQLCHTVREDGAYIEVGENDNLVVQKLSSNPAALGVFGFSFLDQNSDKIQGAFIEGQSPVFDSIVDKSYPVSRSLYLYIKKAHIGVVPGIEEYMAEFTSERAWGVEGYLAGKGMIPLDKDQRGHFSDIVARQTVLNLDDLE